MAEATICFVLEKLVQLLAEETRVLKGIHNEVVYLKDELESIRSFLRDADKRLAYEGDIETWIQQVREQAFHIEDIIDSYRILMAPNFHHHGLFSFLPKINLSIKNLLSRRKIASQIRQVKDSVKEIKGRSERYNLNSSELGSRNVTWHDPRMGSLFIDETEVVGTESPRNKIVGWLKNDTVDSRIVIAIVGMGGSGKTTLAKKIYDSQSETRSFDCHAWITVSQSYNNEELLKRLLNQFHKTVNESVHEGINTSGNSLITQLRDYLLQKRYFIVFDDVWNIDFWGGLEHALPDSGKGSRIIITTRTMEVADFCKKSSLVFYHKIQPLSPEESWELFCKRTFKFEFGGYCPPELEKLSRSIVGKCEGLPLAITAVAGLLSTKDKTVFEWKKLQTSFSSEFESNPHLLSVDKILSLSYDDLPFYLKLCFLYFGIFPEDYSVNCRRLMRLWMAEGFVQYKQDKTPEEVAKTYLVELIHRSMVQVTKFEFDGKPNTCKVHDLLREIILRKMKDMHFCQVIPRENSTSETTLIRRLSTNDKVSDHHFEGHGKSYRKVRSLLMFNIDKLSEPFWSTLFINFKLLKVLDFEGARLNHIPESVGNLFLLTYLSLRKTNVMELPKTIGKLLNLETLDLAQSNVYEIPIEVTRLSKLRFISGYQVLKRGRNNHFSMNICNGVKIHKGVGRLQNLQSLNFVELSHEATELIEELGMLTQLRKLAINKLTSDNGKTLCVCIERMRSLESLEICSASEDEILDLQHISSPPEFLYELILKGRFHKLPNWISKLQNLTRMWICWAKFKDEFLKELHHLPSLMELWLGCQAYDGMKMWFESGGFLKLKFLHLGNLIGLRSLIIDKGALPLLQRLTIGPCPQMKNVPSDIKHLKNLSTLKFIHMGTEFEDSIDPINGKHYSVVKHIPSVLLNRKARPDFVKLRKM